jgi:NTE family protein
MRKLLLFSLLCNLLLPVYAQTQTEQTKPQPNKRPKICLALSGGGARGFAHVGVLKVLEDLHVPIDCIAGTSMGAVVGGLYAAGLSATEIEQRLDKLNLNDIALDRVDRQALSQNLRDEDDRYPLGATVGLSEKGVRLPSGAVQATQFLELLQNWTAHLQPDISFDQMPVQFRAVATDLETGKMVLFDHGPLHIAIRASMAAPGVFAPIEVNGHLLTDGGLVRNLPVDIAKSMGADIVIAVNIGTPLLPRDNLQSLLKISQQMVNILTEQNVELQKSKLGKQDILIEPDLGNITFLDFGRSSEASKIGANAALAMQAKLSALSIPENEYVHKQITRRDPELPVIKIAFVEVDSNGAVPDHDILRQLNIKQGEIYNAEEINRKLAILNNSREFDSISHELIRHGDDYGVLIHANGRNWGPHFLRFGLALSSGFDGVSGYQLQIGHRRPWLTDGGLEWRNDLKIGNVMGLRSELRQPLFEREGMYFAPYVDLSQNPRNYYIGSDRVAEYSLRNYQVGLDLAVPFGPQNSLGEFRTGLDAARYRLSPNLGGFLIPNANGSYDFQYVPGSELKQLGLRTSFVIDQLDTASFPRHGYKVDSSLMLGLGNSDEKFDQFEANAVWADSWDKHSINFKLSGAALFHTQQEDLVGIGSTLGGFQQLSAFQPDQFSGDYKLYGSVTYLLRAVNFEMAGQSIFLGTSLEAGNVWNSRSDISLGALKKSASLFVGFNSFMGPIYVGFAFGTGGARSVFFQMGRQ